jgi:hypothetical protein
MEVGHEYDPPNGPRILDQTHSTDSVHLINDGDENITIEIVAQREHEPNEAEPTRKCSRKTTEGQEGCSNPHDELA